MKGIQAQDLLAAVAAQEGGKAAQDLAKRLKTESGQGFSFEVVTKGRRRKKHRWGSVQGKVIGVRFTNEQYAAIKERADIIKISPGDYLKWAITHPLVIELLEMLAQDRQTVNTIEERNTEPPRKIFFETVVWCENCQEVVEEPEPIYECGSCGNQFSRSNSADGMGHSCPDCNKWGSKITDIGCPDCQEEAREEEAGECPYCEQTILKTNIQNNKCPECGKYLEYNVSTKDISVNSVV